MPVEHYQSALVAIQRAIQNEIAGQRFYDDAAFHCIDPWAKEVFDRLAREEEEHVLLLLGEYESLMRQERWLPPEEALQLGAGIDIAQMTFPSDGPKAKLFPPEWSAEQAIDRRADDLSALAFGLEIEEQSIALYQREAQAAKEPAAREAYLFLVAEERRHYQQLQARWENLAGMSWPEENEERSNP
jgi:rubrerythrin